jgi:hypothetical protein
MTVDCMQRTKPTIIGVPFVIVMRALLCAHELLINDFFEADHYCGCLLSKIELMFLDGRDGVPSAQ